MNSTEPRSSTIEYRDHDFRYDSDILLDLESDFVRGPSQGKQYRQKRSGSPKRRKQPKASHPGCGLAGRRNRRWSW